MWKPIYNPGPWQSFLKRRDNLGMPLMEVRKKYLEEQILFENYISHLQTLNTLSPSVGGSGGEIATYDNIKTPDTGSQDTGSQDTGSQDTGSQDTGSQDTGSYNTGSDPNVNELSGSGLIGSSSYFTNSRTLYAYYPPS